MKPAYRKQGIAKQLMAQAEHWARQHNCTELASDTELKNRTQKTLGQKFHEKLGFAEVERTVHFIKKVG